MSEEVLRKPEVSTIQYLERDPSQSERERERETERETETQRERDR